MTAADVSARVTAALAELGDTPDAVADRLRALDCKGSRGSESMCPVALYLARIDGRWVAEITTSAWVQYDDAAGELTQYVDVALPDPVERFVYRFDTGVYLDLCDNLGAADDTAVA